MQLFLMEGLLPRASYLQSKYDSTTESNPLPDIVTISYIFILLIESNEIVLILKIYTTFQGCENYSHMLNMSDSAWHRLIDLLKIIIINLTLILSFFFFTL